MLPKETKLTKTDNKTGDHGLGLKMEMFMNSRS